MDSNDCSGVTSSAWYLLAERRGTSSVLLTVESFWHTFLQWISYGHGTHWQQAYYAVLIVPILGCITSLYGLRYRMATWDALPLVKIWNIVMVLAFNVQLFLPLPGFLSNAWLDYVPFRSPTLSMALFYFMVR